MDGIETENHTSSAQRFDFSPSATQSFRPSPDLATPGDSLHKNYYKKQQISRSTFNSFLFYVYPGAQDGGDTMETIEKLKHEVNLLPHLKIRIVNFHDTFLQKEA